MKLKGKENYIYKWQYDRRDNRRTELSKKGFYNSSKWRKLRQYKLSLNPLCEHCLMNDNKYIKGYIVDHIDPIYDENDEKAYDIDNLQTLCYYHHQRKTIMDNSKYNPKNLKQGKELQDELDNLD
ncbi:MAG: HNH endonuclease signature motif containing protein [bacterium]